MARVLVTDTLLDSLADEIADKANISAPLTIAQMTTTVHNLNTSGTAVVLQDKTANPSSTQQVVTADTGYTALNSVTITPVSSTTLTATANGTYTATGGTFYSSVVVNVDDSHVTLQPKTVTPSNIPVSVTPDSGYQGLSSVTVEAIPSSYADVTSTTATVNDVLEGKTFISSTGSPKTGLLQVCDYYVGSSEPSSSTGNDGDIYLKI